MKVIPTQQVPGVYNRKIGDILVTAVSDGYLDGNLNVMRNVDLDAAHKILADAFRPARRTSVNTFLVFSQGRIALIDAGCGDKMAATGGKLTTNLAVLGLDFNDIDTVLLTHLHPDHVGALTDKSGKASFPKAELAMHEAEQRYWSDPAAIGRADEMARKIFFKPAQDVIESYQGRTQLFASGEIFPGVTAIPSPGHTPGHTAFLVASGDQQLMIWGDTVHVPEIQTALPQAGMSFDTDLELAAVSRKRMFDRVATDKLLVAGMHTHFPGFGHLVREGDGFRFLPEGWQYAC